MRIAVGLPSLERGTPLRRALDATLDRVAAAGHEVEGFAEHDRTGDLAPFPVYHYLRMPERHAAAAFDIALYPLGRDASPYQGTYGLMQRFPGVVWLVDAVVHHLALGGIALMGDWAAYRALLDGAYGDDGAAVAQTVATNWGTGALFRRYDLMAATAAGQRAVLAAWPALAERVGARLPHRSVRVTPLAFEALPAPTEQRVLDIAHREDAPSRPSAKALPSPPERVAIMTVNESYATTAVRAAAAALELGTAVTVCLSEPIYKAEGRRVAEHLAIHERIDWCLTTSPRQRAAVAAEADLLAWLAEELQGGHRLQLLAGLAAGTPTVVPDFPLYADLPDGVVARLSPGRALPPSFAALITALRDDTDLRAGLAAAGSAFAASCPGPEEAARLLVESLEEAAAAGPLRGVSGARRAWGGVATQVLDAALPGGAPEPVAAHLRAAVESRLDTDAADVGTLPRDGPEERP